jgi:hypothetical protein
VPDDPRACHGGLDKPAIVQSAGTVFAALHGPSLIGISVLWGLTLVLFAWAAIAANYSAWIGRLGFVAGGATFIGATAPFLRPSLFDGVIVYGGLVSIALLTQPHPSHLRGRRSLWPHVPWPGPAAYN